MKNFIIISMLLLGLAFGILYSCNSESWGFALPQGDIEKGKETFFELGCNHCHSAGDIQWIKSPENINIRLGGEVSSKKTYGELVTSIINPSHKIAYGLKEDGANDDGTSRMRNYNEVMTVQNLVDLVTFLQDEYEVNPPPAPYYVY